MLYSSIEDKTEELKKVLAQLDDKQYAETSSALHGTSVGEHVRHIIEIFQCLILNYTDGIIAYDKRERNKRIETEKAFAIDCLNTLVKTLRHPNKPLLLLQEVQGTELKFDTTYERELLYNLEHCIHHQALIKIALMQFENVSIPEDFGIAPATVKYKNNLALSANI